MKKKIGQAILNYERALYLDPENADIKANLALARKNFGLVPNPARAFLEGVFHPPSPQRMDMDGGHRLSAPFSLTMLLNGIRPGLLKKPAI